MYVHSLPNMKSAEESNYLSHNQQLLFEKSGNIRESVDLHRNCLINTYSASTQLLTNENSLKLLKINLNKIVTSADIVNKTHENVLSDLAICKQDKETVWHSNLQQIDMNSILECLQCSHTTVRCPNTLNNLKNYERLKDFSQCFDQNVVIKEDTKIRRIAKSFTPQSCNLKDKRNMRAMDKGAQIEAPEKYNNLKRTHSASSSSFKTAFEELKEQNLRKHGSHCAPQNNNINSAGNGGQKRKLGSTRRNVQNKFVSPMLSNNGSDDFSPKEVDGEWPADESIDERLKNIEPRMVELIRSEIMDCGAPTHWDDIAGLEFAKNAIQEAVVWPLLRPDIFTGLRRPPKGILLFGPPGTGKTLIGKCVASQSKSTFFSISASSLTSKWIGDGEKMVRALFCVARCHQPSVIFIDEIDSLLSQRSDTEHESSRRIKTEFLVQLDGATTDNEERILVIGATNRPQELDEAARRRFVKRLYIPLPEYEARMELVTRLMEPERHNLIEENIKEISLLSDGYSGADMKNLCSEASLGPIRCIDLSMIQCIQPAEVRPISMEDFVKAFTRVRSSVSPGDLDHYIVWNKTYGSGI